MTGSRAAGQRRPVLADLGWRDFFARCAPPQLIAQALANNRDLRVAVLNIEQARAQYQIQRAELCRARMSAAACFASGPGRPVAHWQAMIGSLYDVSVGVTTYELDLFGRVRNLEGSALERFFATEEARARPRSALIAEVATPV